MIYYLSGKVEFRESKFLVMEVVGVGYKVFCSPNTLNKITEGQELKIFTHLHLKEDVIELYGFLSAEELNLFDILNEISGVGPKTAMMLASLGSLEKLKGMMEEGRLPREIKGIGQKRMQKILLELTGKIKELRPGLNSSEDDEALDALISLGFTKQKAKVALSGVAGGITKEERIKRALSILGKG